ncbi:hypothetical protein RND81_03G184500 [Saponaria officinalis]|uniref:DUF4057 domain-containing protein n=1 Tax=Saponaria officinalis TaxID=3572 RepID=A0AAW1M8V7_SAPOF
MFDVNLKNGQPSDGISKVVFGGKVTDEEFESLLIRKPCSENKRREMTGSRIFAGEGEEDVQQTENAAATLINKSGLRMYQQTLAGMSQISFTPSEISPKKPTTLPEVAKQRELSGNLNTQSDAKLKKQLSDAKFMELSGHNIFAPPPEITPRDVQPSPAFRVTNTEPVVKTAKKIPDQKFAHLSGNNIFKDDDTCSSSVDKPLSMAKLREITGNDIFSDGKAESRDYYSGVRKPPGGESSIALV